MKALSRISATIATGLALIGVSGTASALTVDGAVFSGSVTGNGTTWQLTMNLNFTGATAASEFLGDNLESWSLQLPESASVSFHAPAPANWSIQNTGKTDGNGCGNGAVDTVCVDWKTLGSIDGGGPLISTSTNLQFVIDIIFATAQNDYASTFDDQNFHILSVRYDEKKGWYKDGGLISLPLGSSSTSSGGGSTGGGTSNGSVPEPGSTLTLLGLGLLGLGFSRRMKSAKH